MPTEEMWTALGTMLKSHPAELMVWEGEPLDAVESRLAGMGIESVVFYPCSNVPRDGDFGSVMLQNVDNLKTAAATDLEEAD